SLLATQAFAEALHDPGHEAATLPVLGDPPIAFVLRPQPLGGAEEEGVNVARHLEVLVRAADLEDVAAHAVGRPVARHPDRLDEEMLAEDRREQMFGLRHAAARLAELPERIAVRRAIAEL